MSDEGSVGELDGNPKDFFESGIKIHNKWNQILNNFKIFKF